MLEAKQIKKIFSIHGQQRIIFDSLSFTIVEPCIVSFVGLSGVGKTTLLRCLAGLDLPTEGVCSFQGNPIVAPLKECGIVFQNYSCFPWLTVQENIEYGLIEHDIPTTEREKLVNIWLERVGLSANRHDYIKHLSGGMKQRVALARTMCLSPLLLLLDEPFGALDSYNRSKLQDLVLNIWNERPFYCVLVTHEIEEAVTLSDQMFVLTRQKKGIAASYTNLKEEKSEGYRKHIVAQTFDLIASDGLTRAI